MMDISTVVGCVKFVGGLVVGRGINNVVSKSLGWTVGCYDRPLEKVITAIGVYAIGQGVSKMVCDQMDQALDKIADGVIELQDKLQQAKEAAEDEDDYISEV